jgi:glutamate racemase
MPVIGIEPAVKPAALADDSSSVIVMATPLTIHEDKYQKLAAAFCHEANVISLPCKGLAEMVEQGIFQGPEMDAYLQELLLPFRHCSVEYIVLGCTHYPFLRKAIRKNFGRPVEIIDGSDGTARQLRRQLAARDLLSPSQSPGHVTFQNSLPEKLPMSQQLFEMDY